jgi:sporulation protein YlmC with PRC-barrel domain
VLFSYTVDKMLKLSSHLHNVTVFSLRSGGPVATASLPIINPHNLKIIGWWCKMPGRTESMVLLSEDVREENTKGLAINDEEDITPGDDLVRLKEVLHINYELIGKPVKTKGGKVGKVTDYSYNDGMFVQKLYVERPLHKILTTEDTVLIDRNQIVEVTDHYILVKDVDIKEKDSVRATDAIPA